MKSFIARPRRIAKLMRGRALLIVDPPTFVEKKIGPLDSLFSTAANCFGKVVRLISTFLPSKATAKLLHPMLEL